VLLVLVLLQLSVYHVVVVYFILAHQKLAVQLVQAINTKTLLTMSAPTVILAVQHALMAQALRVFLVRFLCTFKHPFFSA